MIRNLLISAACICVFTSTWAQFYEYEHSQNIDFSLNDSYIGSICATNANNELYSLSFNGTPYPYGIDILGTLALRKFDTAGNLIFTKTIANRATAREMLVDANGDIYFTISFVDQLTYENTVLSFATNGLSHMLVKLNADGALLWYLAPNIENSFVSDLGSIALDANQNIWMAYDDFQNSYLQKLNPNGMILQTIVQDDVPLVSAITTDALGNIYTAGSCSGLNANFNGSSATENFDYNTYVAKYNANGSLQWVRFIEDITCSSPQLAVKNTDEIYLATQNFLPHTLDGISVAGPNTGGTDFLLGKLNSNGTWQWVREVPNAGSFELGSRAALAVAPNGTVFLAGSTSGTISWADNVSTTATEQSGVILALTGTGTVSGAKVLSTDGTSRFDAVATDSENRIYVSGYARTAFNNGYVFSSTTGRVVSDFLDITEAQLDNISIYPNPTTSILQFGTPISGQLAIYDTTGIRVWSGQGTFSEIDVNHLAVGMYLLKINDSTVAKFLKR